MDNLVRLTQDQQNSGGKKMWMNHFPDYAAWLLHNHLPEYTRELLRLSREENIPLLRYFSSYSDDELFKLSETSNIHLLTRLAANESDEYIAESTESFISNTIGSVDRDAVIIEDITLVALVRRRLFRFFLKNYTSDTTLFFHVMEEVERFTANSEAASFRAYHTIQQQKIQEINAELAIHKEELLEAQSLAEMGSFFWELSGGRSTYSPGALGIFGFAENITFEQFIRNVHPADGAKINAAINTAIREGGLYECEYSYIVNNVEKRIWSRGLVRSENGRPASMRGTIRDITKKHLLMQSLQQSEELHKQAQAITHIGNWSWSIADNKIFWSDEMYRIYGLEPQCEEITVERFMSFIHPDDREKRKKEIEESLISGVSEDYLLRIVNPDGRTKILKGKGEILINERGEPIRINGTCQDVTREHALNKELREKEENFRQLIQNAPDAIIVINENNIITLWNPKTEAVFGWTVEEAVGRSLSETIIPKESRQAHEHGMKRLLSTGESRILNKTLELTACNKQQDEIYISLTVSETLQGGKKAFIAFLRDITLQKQTQFELAKKTTLLEHKNLELERINQELESFNFVASHDLQEPLRKIQIYSSRIIAKNEDTLDTDVKNDLDKIGSAAGRMQQLIKDLLSFSKDTLQKQDTEMVNLNLLIEEVKDSFITDVEEKKVQLITEVLPTLKVVRFQFLQLFINLLSNAIKYQQPGIKPSIHISSSMVEGRTVNLKGMSLNKRYLAIEITDNGIGFEPQYAEKIFDLFARLHNRESYGGTGIGLATCKKIVHNHEGFITAKGQPGKGACFTIYLPEECVVIPLNN